MEKTAPKTTKEVLTFSDSIIATTATIPEYFKVPTTPSTEIIFKALQYRKNINNLATNKQQALSQKVILMRNNANKDQRQIVIKGKNHTQRLTINNETILRRAGAPCKKLWQYFLKAFNEQVLNGTDFTGDRLVVFPLQDIVDLGITTDKQTARNAFNSARKAFLTINLGTEYTTGKQNNVSELAPLFAKITVDNSNCFFKISKEIDLDAFRNFYTIFPSSAFSIPDREFDLCQAIFSLARQNTDRIAKEGQFTISFKVLIDRLRLPKLSNDPKQRPKNPQRDIRNALLETFEGLNEFLQESGLIEKLAITCEAKDNGTIEEFVNTGKLRVEIKKDYAEIFATISERKTAKIEERKKRNQKIADNVQEKIRLAQLQQQQEQKEAGTPNPDKEEKTKPEQPEGNKETADLEQADGVAE